MNHKRFIKRKCEFIKSDNFLSNSPKQSKRKPTLHPQTGLFLLFTWTKFYLFYHSKLCWLHYSILGARGLLSARAHQSETLRCPRAHFPNSRIINWKSRGNVIQFFSSLNHLHISSSQEAQRLGHFKAQPCTLVRQLARRRISFSRLTFAVKGGVCIIKA